MRKHEVKCKRCGIVFDTNVTEFIKEKNRYSHKICPDINSDPVLVKELADKDTLANYIMETFGEEIYNDRKVWIQIAKFYKEGYTPIDIYHTLYYIYTIKKKRLVNNNFGLIPYYIKEATDYFSKTEQVQKINEEKVAEIEFGQFNIIELTIKSPQRKKKRKNLFSFLDEEGLNG